MKYNKVPSITESLKKVASSEARNMSALPAMRFISGVVPSRRNTVNGNRKPNRVADKKIVGEIDWNSFAPSAGRVRGVDMLSKKENYNIVEEIIDTDAQDYFNRIALNGGLLTNLEKSAINTLVLDLKEYGIWTKIKAAYPMVGSSAAACAVNLKSSSFKGTFTSGWTFAATGATPNGISAYMNTFWNPSTEISNPNDGHLAYYSRTESVGTYIDIGCFVGSTAFDLVIRYNNVAGACINMTDANVFSYTETTKGFFIGSQNNTPNIRKYVRDGSVIQTQSIVQNEQPNANVFVGARNSAFFSNRECAFASIGNGLSDTEAFNYNTVVQQFQTNLSRNV